ncbi:hypothetical protein NDU88_005831 [Pleurodeles waltl]|uniref:Uncharacterized protein n=1 Tax=Pleurodeles waltl TaxID=8319 RepID=A0AAV7N6Z2_PLEWA|nr:hypothetical protein NDU88_005831 [Pleurodeles waltl]
MLWRTSLPAQRGCLNVASGFPAATGEKEESGCGVWQSVDGKVYCVVVCPSYFIGVGELYSVILREDGVEGVSCTVSRRDDQLGERDDAYVFDECGGDGVV